MSAVIDERSFAKNKAAIDRAKADPTVEVVAGGTYDDSEGYFVRPTVLVSTDPENEIFKDEYFGPILGVYVYDDADYDAMLTQMESASAYGLTGCVIARDRAEAARTCELPASRPATSTSTTSRPAPSSASSPSAAAAPPAPTTRPAPSRT